MRTLCKSSIVIIIASWLLVAIDWPISYFIALSVNSYTPTSKEQSVATAVGFTSAYFYVIREEEWGRPVDASRQFKLMIEQPEIYERETWAWRKLDYGWKGLGFRFESSSHLNQPVIRKADGSALLAPNTRHFMLRLPHWFLLACLSIVPTVLVIDYYRRRGRTKRGQCIKCGYDLRESHTYCPECGSNLWR